MDRADKVRMSGREGRRTVKEMLQMLQHQGQIQSIDWTFSLSGKKNFWKTKTCQQDRSREYLRRRTGQRNEGDRTEK